MVQIASRRPPGPAQLPLVGNSLSFGRDPYGFLLKAASMGPLTTLRLFSRPFYLASSAELVQQGLVQRSRSMRKDDVFEIIRRGLGNGLATSENPLWRRQRKLMAHAFTPSHVQRYGDKMVDAAIGTVEQWSNGQTVDLYETTAEIALEAVSSALFDVSVRREAQNVFRSMNAIGDFFVEAFVSPIPLPVWWPSPRNIRFNRACKEMDSVLEGIVGQRRHDDEDRGDLLSTLIRTVGDDGERMSDRQVRDECMTMLVAGHETSGLAFMYTFYLLARHPEIERRVRQEIQTVLNGRRVTASNLPLLPLTTYAIKEALRLYPPAWMTARVLLERAQIGDYSLPEGSALIFSPWVTHRDPDVFENPEAFDPDRWSPERSKGIPKFAFFPFGAGPRSCIGHHFATMELGLIVTTLLQRCSFELVSEEEVRLGVSVTLRPANAVEARVRILPNTDSMLRTPRRRSQRPPIRMPSQRPPTTERPPAPILHVPRHRIGPSAAPPKECPFHSTDVRVRDNSTNEPTRPSMIPSDVDSESKI